MLAKSCNEYMTLKGWLRDVVGGKNLILRRESALLFLQMSKGYMEETDIFVYATKQGEYENINYRLVDNFEGIDYFKEGAVLCTTFNQTVNDMLENFDDVDPQPFFEALNDYYFTHGENFDGISIAPSNEKLFEELKRGAVLYSYEG